MRNIQTVYCLAMTLSAKVFCGFSASWTLCIQCGENILKSLWQQKSGCSRIWNGISTLWRWKTFVTFQKHIAGNLVALMSSISVVIFYLDGQRGTVSLHLCLLAQQICPSQNLTLWRSRQGTSLAVASWWAISFAKSKSF